MSWQEILTAKDKLFYSVNVFTAKIILDFYFFLRRPPAPPWLNLFRLVDAGTLFKKSSGTDNQNTKDSTRGVRGDHIILKISI